MPKLLLFALLAAPAAWLGCTAHSAPVPDSAAAGIRTVTPVLVRSARPRLTVQLPAELTAYQDVALQARVAGFIHNLHADRGSRVTAGEVLASLDAPDLEAQRAEAEHRLRSSHALRLESSAALERDQATLDRLRAAAAAMPGAVAGNDIHVAGQTVAADQAEVEARTAAEQAAAAAVKAQTALTAYLNVRAPFNGIVVRRQASEGALAGPSAPPLFQLQQLDPLRLVIDVPEAEAVGIQSGLRLPFTVSSEPGRTFYGTVARIAHSQRSETRSMPVELDVANPGLLLAPGMFVRVAWSFQRAQPSLFVPTSAVVRSSERTFVQVIDAHFKLKWVDVTTGFSDGESIEIFGPLAPGDRVVATADDELRPGQQVALAPH